MWTPRCDRVGGGTGSESGGKSTIAQLLMGFYEPSKGQILVNGKPLKDYHNSAWMKKINIVFQEPYDTLMEEGTVYSNLVRMLEEEEYAKLIPT
ncbi:ATP-binding cassette domain-containing protein [Paenibacillus roseipurpureus]|uniref:ATP-binding cassette domain-containing protein n=1 Tax=Paenibacillus roseopurpureus TaxID=2918901 RepID=A0AA96LTJ1_9BACL|nr:ATP-binding cassette domain-containing protein [Paenibacillus sp. MBLB1832]WNR47009.1 ATP-binding cassette domain-containing protein [Paenibacillus sp. MBLB1832]